MRHAYLIIAHSYWNQLEMLLHLLDSTESDIYIHIDKKAKDVPVDRLVSSLRYSNVETYQIFKVYWGSYEMVQTELLLFKEAHKQGYDYYHLLSAADMPIKSQQYIKDFFEENAGYEFVHYDTEQRLAADKEIGRRTRLYHFLQNYRNRYSQRMLNSLFTFLERVLLAAQLLLRVDRTRRYEGFEIKYGSQWVSITNEFVEYILSQQELILKIFRFSNCADELFIQSLAYNSPFRERLYNQKFDGSVLGNMRMIDMQKRGKGGHPYTWRISDWEEIVESDCLFARKFSLDVDKEIITRICDYVLEEDI